ncbi:hypothetical protein [Actinophytocola sp. NPDC049390]|uniref:hypothetical protein n=1 Tax=Actinophytocola sp. NPDC049390 TaxID=3363894 RepID=UPI00378D2CE1
MRLTTGFVLWLVAAAAATAVGLAAVAAIGTDIFGAGQDPLSQSEVDELLTSGPTSPPPTTSSTTRPPPEEKTTVTEGGTVIARCDGALVRVVSASPAQGYQVDPDDDEADDHPSVTFQSGEREIEVRLRCVNGVPNAEIRYDD